MIEVEDNIPIPEEPRPKRRGRPPKDPNAPPKEAKLRKTKRPKLANPATALISALKFISVAQRKAGPTNTQFCYAMNGWLAASDGIITAAHPIEEPLHACLQTHPLIEALGNVESELSITQISQHSMAVISGAFRALISCVSQSELYIPSPDFASVACGEFGSAIQAALRTVAPLATDGAHNAAYAGVWLTSQSALATNGPCLLECWHGLALPCAAMMPKVAAQAVAAFRNPLRAIGGSASSMTFHFENGAWLKTQLYPQQFPPYLHLFDTSPNSVNWAATPQFFEGVESVASFSDSGSIYFSSDGIASDASKEKASTYQIAGLPEQMGFKAKQLLAVKHAFAIARFDLDNNRVVFYKDNIRGVLTGFEQAKEPEQKTEPAWKRAATFAEDDIPF